MAKFPVLALAAAAVLMLTLPTFAEPAAPQGEPPPAAGTDAGSSSMDSAGAPPEDGSVEIQGDGAVEGTEGAPGSDGANAQE